MGITIGVANALQLKRFVGKRSKDGEVVEQTELYGVIETCWPSTLTRAIAERREEEKDKLVERVS